jgi:hypothetical protein
MRVRAALVAVAVALAGGACGPGHAQHIGLKSTPLNLLYGDQRTTGPSVPAARPANAEVQPTTFPSFIAAPVPLSGRDEPAAIDAVADDTTPTRVAESACPAPSPLAVPAKEAGTIVDAPPKPGVYHFRRTGQLQTASLQDPRGYDAAQDAPARPLSPEVVREVRNVQVLHPPGQPEQFQFDVVEPGAGLRTTTTYLIDNTSGIYIERVVTERAGLPGAPGQPTGVESFNPAPAIKIVTLPMAIDPFAGGNLAPAQRGQGVDPLTGIEMQVDVQNQGRVRVDACGERLAGWKVLINDGQFQRPNVRDFQIAGSFVVAPQLGGLVIADDISLFTGRDYPENIVFQQQSAATVNSSEPR